MDKDNQKIGTTYSWDNTMAMLRWHSISYLKLKIRTQEGQKILESEQKQTFFLNSSIS
jgi:hypothetical protein